MTIPPNPHPERVEPLAGAVSEDAIKHLQIRSPLNRAIYEAVRGYTMSNICDVDDHIIGFPLVDLMSNEPPADIGTGEMEMVYLVDEIEAAVLASLANRPADDGAAAPNKEPANMSDYPARIFLEPLCSNPQTDERRWSEDQFEQCGVDNCPHCGPGSEQGKYVLASRGKNATSRNLAEQIVCSTFNSTRYACARAVENARELIFRATLATHPDIGVRLNGLLDAVEAEVCNVVLDPAKIDRAAELLVNRPAVDGEAPSSLRRGAAFSHWKNSTPPSVAGPAYAFNAGALFAMRELTNQPNEVWP